MAEPPAAGTEIADAEAADSVRMEFLFRSREAGKRQVKPSQDIALIEDQILGGGGGGESSDDSDFVIKDEKKKKKGKDNDDSAASSSSGSSSNDDSSEDRYELALDIAKSNLF